MPSLNVDMNLAKFIRKRRKQFNNIRKKEEANSITNQRLYLSDYVKSKGWLIYKIYIYILTKVRLEQISIVVDLKK